MRFAIFDLRFAIETRVGGGGRRTEDRWQLDKVCDKGRRQSLEGRQPGACSRYIVTSLANIEDSWGRRRYNAVTTRYRALHSEIPPSLRFRRRRASAFISPSFHSVVTSWRDKRHVGTTSADSASTLLPPSSYCGATSRRGACGLKKWSGGAGFDLWKSEFEN